MTIFLTFAQRFRKLGRYRVVALIGLSIAIIVLGAALFSLSEGISFGLGLYWSITTATTVGYGDIIPHNTTSRIIAAGVMLTTIPIVGAIFALLAGASVVSRIRRLLGMETKLPTDSFTIVFGSNPLLPRVMAELADAGDPVVLVALTKPVGLSEHVHFIAADPTDEAALGKCDLDRANRALIGCESESDTLVIAVSIHALAPTLEVYALTQTRAVGRALKELGVTHTLATDELVAHTLAKSLETPKAGDVLFQMIGSPNFRMVESSVDASLVSQRLSNARGTSGTLVLGVCRGGTVNLGVHDDPVLTAEDRLIVLESVPAA
jgi:voltage-gated potassium channel